MAGDYKKIAVTLAGEDADDVAALRKRGAELGVQPMILAVHTSGINDRQAQVLADNCDLVWSCASKAVRDAAREKALLQLGIAIPVFAFTLAGKRLLLNRALHFAGPIGHAPIHPAPGTGCQAAKAAHLILYSQSQPQSVSNRRG